MSHFKLSALTEPVNSLDGLEHAVLQSLLNYSKAQLNDPLDAGQEKQGWWATSVIAATGSRDWTLARAKQTTDTLNRAARYTKQALQWLVDEKVVTTIEIATSFDGDRLVRVIDLTLTDNTKYQVTL